MKQKAIRKYGRIEIDSTHVENFRAKIAIGLVERFGMIAGREDGEDTAGRQKARMLSPKEVVTRACDMADMLVNEFESRRWLLEVTADDLDDRTQNTKNPSKK